MRNSGIVANHAINGSAQSALTMILEPNQQLAYGDLTQVIFYGENRCRSAFIMGPIRVRLMKYKVSVDRNGFSLVFIIKPIVYKGHRHMI
jgi:hypothetical protein